MKDSHIYAVIINGRFAVTQFVGFKNNDNVHIDSMKLVNLDLVDSDWIDSKPFPFRDVNIAEAIAKFIGGEVVFYELVFGGE